MWTRCGGGGAGGGAFGGGNGGGGGGGGGNGGGGGEGGRRVSGKTKNFLFARGSAALTTSFVHNFAPMMVAASVCGVRGEPASTGLRIRAEKLLFFFCFFFAFCFFS